MASAPEKPPGRLLVPTAAGLQPLADGLIYAHEHLWLDLTTPEDPEGKLDRLDLIAEELVELRSLGVAALIEQTCRGMGRDVGRLRQLQLASGVQIIPSTGFYHQRFHPPELASLSLDEVVALLEEELATGLDGSEVRPLVLGEIGGSGSVLHPDEEKVLRAVARVARRQEVVVATHAHLGQGGLRQLQLLCGEEGLEPERVLIGHLDLAPTLEEVLAVARQGAYLGFDTIGKRRYAPDERRIAWILALCEAGLGERLLLSCDISRNSYLRRLGGQGYAYLVREFLPRLEAAGLPVATIQRLVSDNPRRFLAAARGGRWV
ncbi:phosphotriesterase [Thermogemmatispora sp.]|uniref:phosphotriesterase family protein n=1 Tax=Thermogemmatispora sp. TaxID=1968838 RepID=UPI0035E442A7